MTAAVTWARLSYRQQRWELILVLVGVAAAAAGMLLFATTLDGLRVAGNGCIEAAATAQASAACQPIVNQYYATRDTADGLLYLSWAAPFGMGALLGAPLVAREIEGRTAQVAWSLGRSRLSWFARRTAFVALFALALLAVLAVTSELLAAAIEPERALAQDFTWSGRRGWLIVARGAGALFLGVLAGAIIGRVLPAILASLLIIGVTSTGVSLLQDRWLAEEAVAHRFAAMDGVSDLAGPGALIVDFGLETPAGEVLTSAEAQRRGLVPELIDEQGRQFASHDDMLAGRVMGHDVQLVIPGSRYPEVTVREGAAFVGLGLLALLATSFVVRRRRPS